MIEDSGDFDDDFFVTDEGWLVFTLQSGTQLMVFLSRDKTALTIRNISFNAGLEALVVRPESSNVIQIRGEAL